MTASGTFAPFRHRLFLGIWIANLIANLGGLIQAVGASWLMAMHERSAELVSLVQVANTLPIMLLALLGGAIADIIDQRAVMIATRIFMLVVSAALTIVSMAGATTPALLLLFTFLIGCGGALNAPAWQASVGTMVPREDLPGAVSLNAVGFNVARSAGPALGGLIVYAAGPTATFAFNTVSYVGLIAMLLRWRAPRTAPTLPREAIGAAMIAGLRYAAMSPNLRNVLLRGMFFGLCAAAIPALSPIIARDALHSGPAAYGLLLAFFGIGAVCGALASTAVRRAFSVQHTVLTASLVFAAATALLALSRVLPLSLLAVFLCGMTWNLSLSTLNVSVQMSSPRWVMARAASLHQMAAFGAMAVGSWLWGALAERSGLSASLLTSAGLQALFALALTRLRLTDYTALNVEPLDRWREPERALAISDHDGPITISVEYRIDEADCEQFLALMAQRSRIRRRDGARRWSLSRDLADPDLWIERFSSPTWHDYVRQNLRMTIADADVGEGLRRLNRGGETPSVRRFVEHRPGPRDAPGSALERGGRLPEEYL